MKWIGKKLQKLRVQRNLTMTQLAECLETNHTQISRIESRLRTPSSELLLKILLFEVSADKLLRDDLELNDEPSANQKESAGYIANSFLLRFF